jgi:hypothetical protein
VPKGILVRNFNLNSNSEIHGNVTVVPNPDGTLGNINFNSNAGLVGGNLYLPGTPTINVNKNAVIQGRTFTEDGVEVIPNPSPHVKILEWNPPGPVQPSGYSVNLNSNVVIEGKIYTRYSTVMPTVTLPTGLPNQTPPNGGNINGAVTLPGGVYNQYINVNTGGSITLGVPGSTTPTKYIFKGLNISSNATVNVVGPVEIYFEGNFNLNSNNVFGNAEHPEWTKLFVKNGSSVNFSSNSAFYGYVVAPDSSVNFNSNSIFNGAVTAKSIGFSSNVSGIVFSLNPISG